jgi:hypothetical protein
MNFKSQVSNFKLLLVAILGVALSSCSLLGGGDNTPEYRLSDLQGLWEENNTQHYVRFTTESSDETGYLYGREWDEAEETVEQDLLDARETLGYPGNGWFKYKFETVGNLTEIHLMDNGGAEIPKSYVVSKLTSTELQYYEKDRKSNKFYFTKMVTTK